MKEEKKMGKVLKIGETEIAAFSVFVENKYMQHAGRA